MKLVSKKAGINENTLPHDARDIQPARPAPEPWRSRCHRTAAGYASDPPAIQVDIDCRTPLARAKDELTE